MDLKTAKEASRRCVPVTYNGVKYKRITQRITNVDDSGSESYSLTLLDYCGSAVVIAAARDVEIAEETT